MITKNCVKEIDYRITDNKPITKLPINYFSTKANTKPETLLYNITTILNECNTANIDFTSGGENNKKLVPLSNRFCDNIILYFVIPAETIKNSKVLQQYVNKEDNNKETTRLQTKILQEIGPYLAEHTEKIKRLFNTIGIAINKTHIKPTHPSTENGEIKQYIKVALPDIELEKIYNIITNTEVLATLNKEGIYINDIDFTQDFHGVINKQEVIEYLLQQDGFRMEGDEIEEQKPTNTILNNNFYVGQNCLTFISDSEYGSVRYKFYNKFVQSIESPSVRGKVGNHFADWLENPEQILKESINKCTETGLLRLEITFYIQNRVVTREYINRHLDYLITLLPPHLLYYNSIQQQWRLIQSVIHYNLLLLDLDNNLAMFSYSINKCTNKVNGFYIKDISTNKISNIIKLYSFNVPIVVLSLRRSFNEIELQQTTLEKELINTVDKRFVLDNLVTYITTGSKYFFPRKSIYMDPASVGLVDSPIVRLRTQKTKCVTRLLTEHVPIMLKQIDNIPLPFPQDKITTINKKKKEEQQEQEFIARNKDLLQEITKNNTKNKEEHQKLLERREVLIDAKQQEAKLKNYITSSFDIPHAEKKKLLDIPDNTHLYIYAIKFVATKYGDAVLIATTNTDIEEIDVNTPLEIYWGVKSIMDYTNSNKDLWKEIGYNIYGSAYGRPVMEIEKKGFYYNASRNKCAIVNVIDNRTTKGESSVQETDFFIKVDVDKQLENENPNILLKHTPINTKEKIDDLVNEGDIIEIINAYAYRGSYLVEFIKPDKLNKEFSEPEQERAETNTITAAKSNKFLDDLIKGKEYRFTVVAGPLKTNPVCKRRCRMFSGV